MIDVINTSSFSRLNAFNGISFDASRVRKDFVKKVMNQQLNYLNSEYSDFEREIRALGCGKLRRGQLDLYL